MIMREEVEWMEEKNHKGLRETGWEEEEECREAGASLWSPVWRSRHPLFIALLLVLQPGVGHRVTPGEEEGAREGERVARRRGLRKVNARGRREKDGRR